MSARAEQELSIWSRLERHGTMAVAVAPGQPASAQRKASGLALPTRLTRIPRRVLDILGVLLWTYVVTKVLVADVDRALLQAVAPTRVWLLDYRLIAYLVLVVVLALSWKRVWFVTLYVVFYPFVVLFVRIPWFLFTHRSWAFFLGLLQAVTAMFRDLKYNIVTKALGVVAAFLIVFFHSPYLIVPSAVYIAWLVVWSLFRRLRGVFLRPSFVEVQRRLIRRIMKSDSLKKLWTLGDEYRMDDLVAYDDQQAQQVATTICAGISINKCLSLWAYQLERYRKNNAPSLMFGVLSYVLVVVATLGGLTLLNLALLKLSPTEYVAQSPHMVAVVLYSLSTFFVSEAGGIHPAGQMAYLLQLLGAVAGGLIAVGLIANVALSFARERNDTATQDLVDELKAEAAHQEAEFVEQYSATIDEAYERLQALGSATAGLVSFLVRAIPPHWA